MIRSSQTLTVGPAHVLEQFGADAVLQRAALSVDLVSTGLIVGLQHVLDASHVLLLVATARHLRLVGLAVLLSALLRSVTVVEVKLENGEFGLALGYRSGSEVRK